jgi:hypothetical protein
MSAACSAACVLKLRMSRRGSWVVTAARDSSWQWSSGAHALQGSGEWVSAASSAACVLRMPELKGIAGGLPAAHGSSWR